ncbi:hypothetical protein HZC30_07095 [Candidatus Woesearchaeota archaeon]|nr:hypothetical protein [Candidatus Woesearchaeota archaeon]
MKTLTRLAGLAVLVVFILSIIPAALAEPGNGLGPGNVPADIPAKEVPKMPLGQDKADKVSGPEAKSDLGKFPVVPEKVGPEGVLPGKDLKEATSPGEAPEGVTPVDGKAIPPKFSTKEELQKYKEHIKLAREKYEELKDHREKAKEIYDQQKDELKDRRARMQKICKETPEQCASKTSEFKVGAQQHLEKTLELVTASVEKITNRVEDSKVLTKEEKKLALEQIAQLEAKLAEEQKKLEALSADTSREEWNAAIREFKLMWTQVRQSEQRIVSLLISSKMENLVEKHDEFYNSMLMRIDALKSKDVDTAPLEEIAAEFKEQMNGLAEDQKAAREAWAKATDREALQQAKDAQQKVRDGMKETKETLHKFVEEYKTLNKLAEATSDASENNS